MTEPTPTAAEVPLDSEHTAEDSDKHAAAQEAGRWRLKFREAEAERDALAARVDALQRAQVDAVIEAHGIKPKALWAAGAQLADLLDDDGVPDPGKVKTAVDAAKEALGIEARQRTVTGLKSGTMRQQPPVNQWLEAFKAQR